MRLLRWAAAFALAATAAAAQVPMDSLLHRVERSVAASVLEGGTVEVAPMVGPVLNGANVDLEVDVEAGVAYTLHIAGDPDVWLGRARRIGVTSRPADSTRSRGPSLLPLFPREQADVITLGPWAESGPRMITLFSPNCIVDCRAAYAIVSGPHRVDSDIAIRLSEIVAAAEQAGASVVSGPSFATLGIVNRVSFSFDLEADTQYDLAIVRPLARHPRGVRYIATMAPVGVHLPGASFLLHWDDILDPDGHPTERFVSIGPQSLSWLHSISISARGECVEGCEIGYVLTMRDGDSESE